MKTYKNGMELFKVPLLIISLVVIFSFSFNTVNASNPSDIYVSPAGNDLWNG